MARTTIDVRQVAGTIWSLGTSLVGGNALFTLKRGTSPVATILHENEGSQHIAGNSTIDGDLYVGGKFTFNGAIDQENVTDLNVKDKTISLNVGGSTVAAIDVGIQVEGDSGSIISQLLYNAGKWYTGLTNNAANEIATTGTTQTLSAKTLVAPTVTGNATFPTQNPGTNNQTPATTGFVAAALAGMSSSTYQRATTVTGTQDGTNKTFTLANALATGSEQIFMNGQLLTPGASNDYQISGATLTFQANAFAPISTDTLRAYGVY